MIRALVAAVAGTILIVSSSGCVTLGVTLFLMTALDDTPPQQKAGPYTGVVGVEILKTSPRGNRPISSTWASVRVAVSVHPTAKQPYLGVCLARDRSTIITDSCSWRSAPPGSGVMNLSPKMPRDGTGRLFTESYYVTAVLVDGSLMNPIAPPGAEVPLTSLRPRQLAHTTVAMTWRWK